MSSNTANTNRAVSLHEISGEGLYYMRTVDGYRGASGTVTQLIRVRKHGSGHVKIDLFISGEFAGTWIKTAQHFANIMRWGSWVPARGEALALARASASIPHGLRDALAEALEKAVPEWVGSVKKKE